jgi:hypothetical protein
MRGYLINAEIFLNVTREEILFDREMGQLNFACIHCSKLKCRTKPTVFTF